LSLEKDTGANETFEAAQSVASSVTRCFEKKSPNFSKYVSKGTDYVLTFNITVSLSLSRLK